MCGIFGCIGKISYNTALQCLNTLNHRGPDGYDIWSTEQITLGHTRLSILDLSDAGKQPMSYGNKRYWITFNGEVYNFIELRNELTAKGYRFYTDTDTEVIIASYIEWGEGCTNKFNGMWAFAIWDSKEEKIFISRDRFGQKPLFYIKTKSYFAFASEMKALLPIMDNINANERIFSDKYLLYNYEGTDKCVVKDIKRLLPGNNCSYTKKNNRIEIKKWWNTLDNLVEIPNKYEKQVEHFNELFYDSCKLRLRSDVSIGTALSGGVDSSAVLAVLSEVNPNKKEDRINSDFKHAFVASFKGTHLDEDYYAKLVVEHLGVKNTFIDITPIDANKIYDCLYIFEDICATTPMPFMQTYGGMKDKGIKISIDGHGADEVFGGYADEFIFSLLDSKTNVKRANDIINAYLDSFTGKYNDYSIKDKISYWYNWINSFEGDRLRSKSENHPRWKELDYLSKILYISTHEKSLPTILRNFDRFSMSKGIEVRMPFMDYRLICYAFSLPWSSKIRNSYSKKIIRDGLKNKLPVEVLNRKSKIGFGTPIVQWMKGEYKEFFMDEINSQAFKTCSLINPNVVANKVLNVINNIEVSYDIGNDAWFSIMPYLWEQSVIKRRCYKC